MKVRLLLLQYVLLLCVIIIIIVIVAVHNENSPSLDCGATDYKFFRLTVINSYCLSFSNQISTRKSAATRFHTRRQIIQWFFYGK